MNRGGDRRDRSARPGRGAREGRPHRPRHRGGVRRVPRHVRRGSATGCITCAATTTRCSTRRWRSRARRSRSSSTASRSRCSTPSCPATTAGRSTADQLAVARRPRRGVDRSRCSCSGTTTSGTSTRPNDAARLLRRSTRTTARRSSRSFARRENIAGYFAGHTHRNRVRRFGPARHVPFVEVACMKDYPGVWAEYRVYEGGYTQVVRRMPTPAACSWTERTRPPVRRPLPRLRPRPPRPPLLHPRLPVTRDCWVFATP